MTTPDKDRYARMPYRRTGRSGLKLPAISLGLWQNFGGDRPIETQRAIVRRAFDQGITHFDLANNYGPPYGSAEENFGRILRSDLAGHRDELVMTLAQMALAWTLRDPRVTSTLIGASSVAQLEQNVGALDKLQFSAEELKDIDRYATDSGINLWAASSAG